MKKILFFLACACALIGCKHSFSSDIRINQVGFAPDQEKTATIDVCAVDAAPCAVAILSEIGDTVWTGMASATMLNSVSGKPRQLVDFSSLTTPGTYHLIASSPHRLITSSPFTICLILKKVDTLLTLNVSIFYEKEEQIYRSRARANCKRVSNR